jgi:hypothetical protein
VGNGHCTWIVIVVPERVEGVSMQRVNAGAAGCVSDSICRGDILQDRETFRVSARRKLLRRWRRSESENRFL